VHILAKHQLVKMAEEKKGTNVGLLAVYLIFWSVARCACTTPALHFHVLCLSVPVTEAVP